MNAPRQDLRARQTRLHDYQAMLARRLREARNLPVVESYLGVLVGQRNWLLPLTETGEVLEMRTPASVPKGTMPIIDSTSLGSQSSLGGWGGTPQ